MGASKPMKIARAVVRLTEDERAKLDQLCEENDVTLSYALRKGAMLYLEDMKAEREARQLRLRVGA